MAILDVDMPEMDGVQAFAGMKEINPDAKVIFVTGLSDSGKSEDAANSGAVALLRKPFDPRDLSKKISLELLSGKPCAKALV
jgi:CheY-like chemotaxis protein